MITLALDAMGSDLGPEVAVKGAASFSLEPHDARVLLVGDEPRLRELLAGVEHDASRIQIKHALEVISMDEGPREAVEKKPNASVLVAARAVADGEADALVSAGNTGAVTLACARTFRRLEGVGRCALGAVYPTERRRGEKNDPFSLILDVGLTLEASADDLVAFAIMGAAYASRISSNKRPRVALLSNGSEDFKGTQAVKEAHARLRSVDSIEFIGNIEGMDIPRGTADVVVTAGFVGNIVLKMLEGVAETIKRLARYAANKSFLYRAGFVLLGPALHKLRAITDWQQYGGAPILGFDRLCIKAHGRSSARAYHNALKVAHKAVRTGIIPAIAEGLKDAKAVLDPSTDEAQAS